MDLNMITDAAHHVLKDKNITEAAAENTYAIAKFIMKICNWVLDLFGLEQSTDIRIWIYTIIVFFLAWGVGYVFKWIVLGVVDSVGRHIKKGLFTLLVEEHFFSKLCKIIPPFVFLILIQFTLYTRAELSTWLTRLTWIYVLVTVAIALSSLVNVIWIHIDSRENKRRLPLRGLMQLVKGIVWIVVAIIIVAMLMGKSPGALLAGLGAFAAVLMLIFKDSILGVVAGVQLSENDTLRVGDWIKVNGTDANGVVQEVSLTSVKVLNWDKTTTTLPPYSLISGSFTNYRSMQESGTRRIQRCYMIDADSVVELDDNMLAEFRKLPFMDNYIKTKIEQRDAGKTEDVNNSAGLVDGTIVTNLGLFRAYLKMYLDANDLIDKESTCFISTLQQTSGGIPLQIYCFTATSSWLPYEAIQDGIFEHLSVMLYKFHLYTFENPSGRDTLLDGYMSPGKNPDVLYGLPYPFFNQSGTPENPAYPPQKSVTPEPNAMQPGSGK